MLSNLAQVPNLFSGHEVRVMVIRSLKSADNPGRRRTLFSVTFLSSPAVPTRSGEVDHTFFKRYSDFSHCAQRSKS